MNLYGQTKIEITKCDNGYVLDWDQPKEHDQYHSMVGGPPRPTSGTEVHVKLKSALDRAKMILA